MVMIVKRFETLLNLTANSLPNRLLLIKKKGSLHLSGIRFCDFLYIIYLYTHTQTGLDSGYSEGM